MSQVDLAKEIHSSAGYIHDLEAGRRNASPAKIKDIALALQCTLPALIQMPDAYERVS